jgi:hypothetical protein
LVSGMAGYAVFGAPREVWFVWNLMGTLFTTLIYFWAASQSCRFFVEARRSGLVELLLASPVTEKELVRGQWRALLRTFGLPVLLLIAVQVTGAALSQNFWKAAAQAGSTNQIPIFTLLPITSAVLAGLTMVANLAAIGWFGMWMGFTSKNATLATLKTFVFVQIVPAMVISLGATMATALMILPWAAKMGAGAKPGPNMLLFPFVSLGVSSFLALAKDTGFVLWSRKHLYYSFRERAARGFSQAQFIRPPLAPPRIPAPPPIIPISPNA